jgi:hypothetical protein
MWSVIWHPFNKANRPKHSGWYLVADSMVDEPYCCYYTSRRGFVDENDAPLNKWIEHWMDLPKRPSAERGTGT